MNAARYLPSTTTGPAPMLGPPQATCLEAAAGAVREEDVDIVLLAGLQRDGLWTCRSCPARRDVYVQSW